MTPKILLCIVIGSFPLVAHAKKCGSSGDLIYLGNTANASRSVWVSATTAGEFHVDATGTEIDRWTKARGGAHLTLSNVVSQGKGGTHKLYATEGGDECLLDTRNQKRGFTLPPNWRPPQNPPTGITPTMPIAPQPPIALLPPTGITPEVPVLPRPPTGITPELPVAPQPPIGTLPPTGVMPTLPVIPRPPTGITPEVPIAPRPPIVTLPPTGITPEVPILPQPPTGIMPELPIAPQPPIGVLPPTGLTPEVPLTEKSREAGRMAMSEGTMSPCQGGRVDPNGAGVPALGACAPMKADNLREPPLTPGRDLVEDSPWNTWVDTHYSHIDNRRGIALDKTRSGALSMGIDRYVGDGVAAGGMVSFTRSRNENYWGYLKQDSNGVLIGPYASFRLADNWTLFGSVSVGVEKDDYRVVTVSGSSDSMLYAFAMNAQGQYELATDVFARPKLGISYQHKRMDDYKLSGLIAGTNQQVKVGGANTDTAIAEATMELNWLERTSTSVFMPYVEAGVRYNCDWQNGHCITGDGYSNQPRWQGLARVGGRALIGKATQVELSASYQGLGVQKYDAWEATLFFSHSF
ncbi:MAG: autotransporter domain-containing protein [Betaproteobacteria bacterium]|nr:autotransporter domain-containing protein [Betaproteobacteria bacterium]